MKRTTTKIVAAAALLGVSLAAYAGYAVYGSGDTKSEAADDANERAQRQADERGTCITEARLEECRKEDDGTWTCVAYVANHSGSCR